MLGLKEPVCNFAKQSWAFKAELIMQRWHLKESVCDSTELDFESRVRNAVLGLKEFVCDLAQQSWTLNPELGMQCWD